MEIPIQPQFARAGSRRWLQIAVNHAPAVLDEAFRDAHAIDSDETLRWCSPLAIEHFTEYRDQRAFAEIGITAFPIKPLDDFWPRRGPVWDGLAVTNQGNLVLVEAKAHIAEVHSPPSRAGEASRPKIQAALEEARKYYAPSSNKVWFKHYYQYCNRLAFHYFVAEVNQLPSKLVFLDFYNATEMHGPSSPDEWRGVSKLVHAFLGLPESLERHGVFHAYIDVRRLGNAVQSGAH